MRTEKGMKMMAERLGGELPFLAPGAEQGCKRNGHQGFGCWRVSTWIQKQTGGSGAASATWDVRKQHLNHCQIQDTLLGWRNCSVIACIAVDSPLTCSGDSCIIEDCVHRKTMNLAHLLGWWKRHWLL